MNQVLNQLKVTKHPDKTWMGKIDRGVDFLGYHHTPAGLTPAKDTYQLFRKRITQLYEQGAGKARKLVAPAHHPYRHPCRHWGLRNPLVALGIFRFSRIQSAD